MTSKRVTAQPPEVQSLIRCVAHTPDALLAIVREALTDPAVLDALHRLAAALLLARDADPQGEWDEAVADAVHDRETPTIALTQADPDLGPLAQLSQEAPVTTPVPASPTLPPMATPSSSSSSSSSSSMSVLYLSPPRLPAKPTPPRQSHKRKSRDDAEDVDDEARGRGKAKGKLDLLSQLSHTSVPAGEEDEEEEE